MANTASTRTADLKPGDGYVQSFARGLEVIRSFSASAPRQTLTEVAGRSGLSRAGARRILLTLEALGYVRSDGKLFSLTPRILDLGFAYLSSMPIWNLAEPVMETLVAQVKESCSAAVLDGTDIVFVARVEAKRIMSMNLGVGSRLPAWATAMGRVLLAELRPEQLDDYFRNVTRVPLNERTITDERRLRNIIADAGMSGWTLVDQEVEEGVRSVAVPLRSPSGRVSAALTVCSHASRVSVDRIMEEFLPLVIETSDRITGELARR